MMMTIIAVMMTSSLEILDSIKSNSIIIIIQVTLLIIDINSSNINLLLLPHLEDNNISTNKNLKEMYFIMIIIIIINIMGQNMRYSSIKDFKIIDHHNSNHKTSINNNNSSI